jgi:hypothetical protein
MAFVILLIIALALLRILIPLLYAFLTAVRLVLWCIVQTIKNEVEKRRERKEWRATQGTNK